MLAFLLVSRVARWPFLCAPSNWRRRAELAATRSVGHFSSRRTHLTSGVSLHLFYNFQLVENFPEQSTALTAFTFVLCSFLCTFVYFVLSESVAGSPSGYPSDISCESRGPVALFVCPPPIYLRFSCRLYSSLLAGNQQPVR